VFETAMAFPTDPRTRRFLAYPYTAGSTGAPKTDGPDDHIRDLILQVLFTNPGERVNLPTFGVGVQQLVFVPNSDALRSSTQFLIQTGLQEWLGDRITTNQVTVSSIVGEEETVTIEIFYTVNATQKQQSLQVRI
jgi:phage baseplate assembly protein W